ncbi:hypothetical protein [Stenotrophomonas sp. 24(2023)]|uniref:hypothetical protein n=1 Tax=Stenotrophomonas sp. 24(2023) TaxID=3068324 RepID=UPI0027E101ED|nr:hypothetical protein [Stenotrophomonas sp. 24(2023)]WMJ68287.1 hypothetical protein Q9R17_13905 [Stenotrophomonas sp. 24(2023)]
MIFACAVFSDHAQAFSRMGEVEISDAGGTPCFGLPAAERKRLASAVEVYAVEVYESDTRPLQDRWAFNHAYPAATPLPVGTCIAYGQAPATATLRHPAAPLQPGRLYTVDLEATREGPTRGYSARFCLKAQADGTLKALRVHYDRRLGWTAATCLP